jgi:hypothetical protein
MNRAGNDGTAWQHTFALQTKARFGGDSVCGERAG